MKLYISLLYLFTFLIISKISYSKEMSVVSLFESEDLVKRLKPLDLNEAGSRPWIEQVDNNDAKNWFH